MSGANPASRRGGLSPYRPHVLPTCTGKEYECAPHGIGAFGITNANLRDTTPKRSRDPASGRGKRRSALDVNRDS